MASGVTLKAAGLNISPNLLELPAGSLIEAKNVIIRRDDIIESRRGFALYGEELPDYNERVKQLFTYKQRILRHYSNKLQFQNGTNNDGTVNFDLFSGNYSETEVGLRIKSIESNGNFYFTTSEGIKKLSAANGDQLINATITPAGVPKAIDLKANLITILGDQESFFTQNGVVAYRVLWGKKDANNNLLLGSPSESVQVYNPLTQLMIRDFNNLLNRLDILKDSGSMINDGNYASTLALNYTDTATELSDALTNSSSGLFTKLDQDIKYATTLYFTLSPAVSITLGAIYSDGTRQFTALTTISSGTTLYASLTSGTGDPAISGTLNKVSGTGPASIIYTSFTKNSPLTLSSVLYENSNKLTVGFGGSPSLVDYFSEGKNLKLNGFLYNGGVNVNSSYSIITLDDATDKISFTVEAPEVEISSVTAGGLVTTSTDHNLPVIPAATYPYSPVAGALRVSIQGVPGSNINGVWNVATVNSASTFTITGAFTAGNGGTVKIDKITTIDFTSAKIESNQYRSIASPVTIDEPGTQAQLLSIQTAIIECISRLQQEQPGVIPIAYRNQYIDDLGETTTASVQLRFSVPDGIDSTNFYQIYRTAVTTPPDTEFLSSFNAGDEMALVYEAFPTSTELTSKTVVVDDNTPDLFRGANLYTNPTTGEGVLQANDQPPFARDINTFKNSVFYANTKTKQRYSLSLIGVEQMVQNYNTSDTPNIIITDGTTTNQYEFILGQKQKTRVSITVGILDSSGTASYFTLNSANNETEYYIWYQRGTSGDPALIGKTGIRVIVSGTDTNTSVATKTISALAPYAQDFSIVKSANCTISVASPAVITSTNHGLQNGQSIVFSTTGILPTGITAGTLYTVANKTNDTFQLSGPINTTAAGSGVHSYTIQQSEHVLIQNTNEGACDNSIVDGGGLTTTVIMGGIGEDPLTNKVLLSQSLSPSIAIEETAKSLVRVINKSTTSNIYAYYISGLDQTPGKMFLEGRGLGDLPFYLVADSTTTGESFTPDLSPDFAITAAGGITNGTGVVNFNLGVSCPYSVGDNVVILDTNSTPLLNGLYTISAVSVNAFSITGGPVIPAATSRFSVRLASDSEFSSNEQQRHRIYYSKTNQPEAVPILNYFDVGASDKAILRIFPLRDSLFVFKEDGLFRVSGESAPFVQGLFDSSCIIIAPDSLGISNNLIYLWTTQGISAVSEAGVSIASRPIDIEILEVASSRYTNFRTATFGIGYDSDNSYIVWSVSEDSDTVATQAFRYSNLTSSWTKYDLSKTCGIINPVDDRLYLGAADVAYIEQERKLFNRTDYADREYRDTINTNSYNDKILKLNSVVAYSVGDVVLQEQWVTIYDFNSLLRKLDSDLGVASLALPKDYFYTNFKASKGSNLRTKLVTLATELDSLAFGFNNYLSLISDYNSTITSISSTNPTTITSVNPHNLFTGRVVTISGSNSIRNINGTFEITVTGGNTFTIPLNVSTVGNTGSWVTDTQNIKDIKACFNKLIERLNLDPVVGFSNYSPVNSLSIQESVVVKIDRVFKNLTLFSDLEYTEGAIKIYKAIDTSFTYAPATMGDPLNYKQIREATLMFINKQFTLATMSFSTDLLPTFVDTEFYGNGSGLFGNDAFGTNFFGGVSHSAPFRTYVPLQCQRCRYINIKYTHKVAREKYGILGITLTGKVGVSTRAYR